MLVEEVAEEQTEEVTEEEVKEVAEEVTEDVAEEVTEEEVVEVAEEVDKLIACGTYSIDELRRKLRDTTLNTKWSNKNWMTKNYSGVENLEGGDSNETNMDNKTVSTT